MRMPSNAEYDKGDLDILLLMRDCGFIEYNETGFTLKSGIRSNVYVQGRNDVTDNPMLGWLLGRKIAQTVVANHREGDKAPCLIFIPTAGTSLAAAASLVAYKEGIRTPAGEITYRIMREAVKAHGAGATNWVNGKFDDKHTFWGGDNVVTDCGSKIEASDHFIESGYPALEMPWLIVVDRQQGGIRKMEEHGFKRIVVVYYLLDIAFAMGELKLWPKEVVGQVDAEIKAHQVL
jgi:orotate phosphoribosyltransferase